MSKYEIRFEGNKWDDADTIEAAQEMVMHFRNFEGMDMLRDLMTVIAPHAMAEMELEVASGKDLQLFTIVELATNQEQPLFPNAEVIPVPIVNDRAIN